MTIKQEYNFLILITRLTNLHKIIDIIMRCISENNNL